MTWTRSLLAKFDYQYQDLSPWLIELKLVGLLKATYWVLIDNQLQSYIIKNQSNIP